MAGSQGRNIVLPVDASEHSERAFSWYLKNLKQDGDHLTIVNVVEPPKFRVSFFSPVVVSDEYINDCEEQIKQSQATTERFKAKCNEIGLKCTISSESSDFGPGERICEIAKNSNASGIVMGSRGLNVVRKTLLGSVSSYVVNHADVPVIVTPPGEHK